jgi:NAD(P)-dependent dehydrogenase (short-subunit alcohol dehydrogenase family)
MGVAIVTGCSSGIGLHTAVELARRGDRVYATMRDPSKSGALRDVAAAAGTSVEVAQLDVTDAASIDRTVADVLGAEGRIDVLVNNAGVGYMGRMDETSEDEFRETFETNVFGPFRVIRAVLPVMKAAGAGRIVNISSVNGNVPSVFAGAYSASKHALEGASFAMDLELRGEGIRVLVVAPGAFRTVMATTFRVVRDAGDETRAAVAQREAMTPHTGDPAEAGRAIADVVGAEHPSIRTIIGSDWGMSEMRASLSDDEYFDQVAEMVASMRAAAR